jgi:hypothetical protein
MKEGRLAAAGRSDDGDELAGVDGQADVPNSVDRRIPDEICLAEVLSSEERWYDHVSIIAQRSSTTTDSTCAVFGNRSNASMCFNR